MSHIERRIVAAFSVVLLAGSPALAAGFSFFEQSAKASGQAGAWIARADDAAANWYNPAALVRLSGGEVQVGVNWLDIGSDTHFTLRDPVAAGYSTGLGFPAAVGDRYDAVSNVSTPAHFYYAQKINEKLAFGLGINTPFGLVSEWKDYPMVLSARRADLATYQVNPNLAIAVNDEWSVGLGVDYLSAEVRDFSRDTVVPLEGPVLTTANLTGEGDAWGYNVGFLFRRSCFSVAANYRSEMSPMINGTQRFSGVAGNFLNSSAQARLNLPAQVLAGIAWTSDRVDVELAANHTQWNRFKELHVVTPNPATSVTLVENWHATWAYRLGVAVRLGQQNAHELRFGGSWDESPIPVEYLRPSIPDSDRTGYTLGYGYLAKRWGIDVYAMHLKFKDITANGSFFSGVINGDYSSSIILIGVTGKYRF